MSSVTFPTTIGGDGSTVTDDDNATTGLRNGGWRTRFIPCFTNQVNIASTLTNRLLTLSDTSASSVAIGLGSKSFTTAKFYNFAVGQFVVVASSASPSNYMYGQVTAYNSSTGALTVSVTVIAGSGTFASWSISCSVASGAHVLKTGDTMTGSLTAISFSGAGTGLTGTASGLSIGGNAATATLSTNCTNAIGYSQTWQSVGGSRSWNTTYTNSTGKPIMLAIFLQFSATNQYATLYIVGAPVSAIGGYVGNGTLVLIIQDGASYQLSGSSPYPGIYSWYELR